MPNLWRQRAEHGGKYAPATQERHELPLELRAKVVDHLARALPAVARNGLQLAHVRLRLGVQLVAIGITASFLTDLTVPAKAREPARLHGIADGLPASRSASVWGTFCAYVRRAGLSFPHAC